LNMKHPLSKPNQGTADRTAALAPYLALTGLGLPTPPCLNAEHTNRRSRRYGSQIGVKKNGIS
jgi:hypothetical protein